MSLGQSTNSSVAFAWNEYLDDARHYASALSVVELCGVEDPSVLVEDEHEKESLMTTRTITLPEVIIFLPRERRCGVCIILEAYQISHSGIKSKSVFTFLELSEIRAHLRSHCVVKHNIHSTLMNCID